MVELDKKEMKNIVIKEIKSKGVEPAFYVISGSHLYGYASEDSDIDIRGFHIAPGYKYMTLQSPKEQYELNDFYNFESFDKKTEYHDGKIDLVSYELKKFGILLSKLNFNVVEWLLSADNTIYTKNAYSIGKLCYIINKYPHGTAKHYYGMAKSNYKRWLCKDGKGRYTPTKKKYLYVFRGLLGALYSLEGRINPNIEDMAWCNLLDNDELNIKVQNSVHRLVQLSKEQTSLSDTLRDECDELINLLFERVEAKEFPRIDKKSLVKEIDDWMLECRGIRGDK